MSRANVNDGVGVGTERVESVRVGLVGVHDVEVSGVGQLQKSNVATNCVHCQKQASIADVGLPLTEREVGPGT